MSAFGSFQRHRKLLVYSAGFIQFLSLRALREIKFPHKAQRNAVLKNACPRLLDSLNLLWRLHLPKILSVYLPATPAGDIFSHRTVAEHLDRFPHGRRLSSTQPTADRRQPRVSDRDGRRRLDDLALSAQIG